VDYLLWEYLLAEPKVSEYHMALTVQQNVLQLDVTVHYAQLESNGNNVSAANAKYMYECTVHSA